MKYKRKQNTNQTYLSSSIFAHSAWDWRRSRHFTSIQRSCLLPMYILFLLLFFAFIPVRRHVLPESAKVGFLSRFQLVVSDIFCVYQKYCACAFDVPNKFNSKVIAYGKKMLKKLRYGKNLIFYCLTIFTFTVKNTSYYEFKR